MRNRQPDNRNGSNRETGNRKGNDREPDTFFSPAAPRVFAHRGLALEAPENTMLAFLKALSAGVDYLELDVHASYDGVAVVAHDDDLTRVADRPVQVAHLTMAELQRVNLGEGQSFTSLADVLDTFPDARLNIDIKSDAAVAPTVEAILDAGAVHRVLIASFSDRRRREAVSRLPGVATSASKRTSGWAVLAARAGLVGAARMLLRRVDAVQLPLSVKGIRVVTPRLVRVMQRAGVEVHVWTVNDPSTMTRLLAMGVDGIVTDRADLAIGLIRDN